MAFVQVGKKHSRAFQGPAAIPRKLLILHLALVGLFLLDLALPRNVPLLPYYFLVVALSASFAVPRQMLPLILQAYGLAIASGLFWGFIPSIDFSVRLLGLSGVVLVAVFLAAQRQRELADRRRSEEVLQLTLDNAAAGIGVTDAEGQFIRVNPAFCTLLGVDPASITTLRWQDLTHSDDVDRELQLVDQILANQRSSYRIQLRLLPSDGRTLWIDLSVSCSRRPNGEVDFLIGQLIDITAQVEAEAALARSQEMLRRTLEHCSVGLALCEPDTGVILQANPEFSAGLGQLRSALVGRELMAVIGTMEQVSGEDFGSLVPLDPAPLQSLLRGDIDCYGVRVRLQQAGRQRGWGELQLSNLRDATGAVRDVLLELDNITDLVAQTEYLQTAAAAGVVGIWDWDVPANVLSWDPVMYQLYGRAPGDFAGAYEAWADAVHPDDRAYAEGEIQAAMRGERPYAPRFRVVWPDGSVHHVQAASRTFFDAKGAAVRILGVNYDVTELVQTQQRLEAEQNRLRTTLDSLLDPHLLLGAVRDQDGAVVDLRILRANPAAAAYNRMALHTFVGSTLRQVLPGVEEKGLLALYGQVLATGEPLVLDRFAYPDHDRIGGTHYYDIRAVKVGEELSVTWRDVSERIAMEQVLQHRATTDSLTALLNREEVFSQMKRLLAPDRRRGGALAVLFCDLDRFKEVNDTYGHQAGDRVLQVMAERIRSCLRTSDLAARIGGDELMAVLTHVQGLDDVLAIAEKVRGLARAPIPIPQGEVQISLSVGVALAAPGESLDKLMTRADAGMYAAKRQGRDQVVAIR